MEDHTTPENDVSHVQREFLKLNPTQQHAILNIIRLLVNDQAQPSCTRCQYPTDRTYFNIGYRYGFMLGKWVGITITRITTLIKTARGKA